MKNCTHLPTHSNISQHVNEMHVLLPLSITEQEKIPSRDRLQQNSTALQYYGEVHRKKEKNVSMSLQQKIITKHSVKDTMIRVVCKEAG